MRLFENIFKYISGAHGLSSKPTQDLISKRYECMCYNMSLKFKIQRSLCFYE